MLFAVVAVVVVFVAHAGSSSTVAMEESALEPNEGKTLLRCVQIVVKWVEIEPDFQRRRHEWSCFFCLSFFISSFKV